MYLIIQKNYF